MSAEKIGNIVKAEFVGPSSSGDFTVTGVKAGDWVISIARYNGGSRWLNESSGGLDAKVLTDDTLHSNGLSNGDDYTVFLIRP